MLAALDPWILAFSLVTVVVTIWMGFRSAKTSKSASDFFVAGRSVSVGWNASAISGEYLSAASFMGVAGMVMSSGYDALWYPVCYACGYLFLLLFIAGPLRRFGAYTIPDFAEGRYDSPLFRKIAVIFVLFIGFFYTMPQMKGAGTTLAYIFPGLPYWVGVVLVGAVITLNVALGGMKGITLVQAFQYWAKMFAISVPIFVLMSVYGGYGKQLKVNGGGQGSMSLQGETLETSGPAMFSLETEIKLPAITGNVALVLRNVPVQQTFESYVTLIGRTFLPGSNQNFGTLDRMLPGQLGRADLDNRLRQKPVLVSVNPDGGNAPDGSIAPISAAEAKQALEAAYAEAGVTFVPVNERYFRAIETARISDYLAALHKPVELTSGRQPLPAKAPTDAPWLNSSGPLTTNLISLSTRMTVEAVNGWVRFDAPSLADRLEDRAKALFGNGVPYYMVSDAKLASVLIEYARFSGKTVVAHTNLDLPRMLGPMTIRGTNWSGVIGQYTSFLTNHGVFLQPAGSQILAMPPAMAATLATAPSVQSRLPLPAKAPKDETWLNPFGPLTTKAAKAAKPALNYSGPLIVSDNQRPLWSWAIASGLNLQRTLQGRDFGFPTNRLPADQLLNEYFAMHKLSRLAYAPALTNISVELNLPRPATWRELGDGMIKALEGAGITVKRDGTSLTAFPTKDAVITPVDPKPYALLYTYSLIIALVCGTAGLPHILVRFYTNPDGVAAKRTTMWVMILIGIFYVFPPVFGVMGRNLMPSLYEGTGAKGTDKVVLELPKVLDSVGRDSVEPTFERSEASAASISGAAATNDARSARADSVGKQGLAESRPTKGGIPWGSILSGITCAGAFAAFMSTFSGLLVSMTGALAHDVYGRILRPQSTAADRMRMFKWCAVLIGAVAVLLGSFVEKLEINFMVGQAFAIAAASYFPLLFMSVWWRGMTLKGAAAGMLTGGFLSIIAISLTSFTTLASGTDKMAQLFSMFRPLADFWAAHPLLRILCEQPAIWTVPLAIGLMVVVSKLTRASVPADIRMKMLVLHAPEKLGLKQEYIKEHEAHGH